MKPFKIKRLYTKIFVLIFSVVVTTAAIFSVYVSVELYNKSKRDYEDSVKREIRLVDQRVYDYIENVKSVTEMLASFSIVREADSRITSYVDLKSKNGMIPMRPEKGSDYEQRIFDVLKSIQESNNKIKNVSIGVEENGGFVKYPPTDRFDGYDARERDWYKMALENFGQVGVSGIYRTSSNEDVILSVMTIESQAGDLVGAVTIDFDLSELSQAISKIKLGLNGYVILMDRNGEILAHPDQKYVGQNIKESELKNFFESDEILEKSGYVENADSSQWVQVIESEFVDVPLMYVAVVNTQEFYSEIFTIIRRFSFMMLGLVYVALAISLIVSKKVTKPLQTLGIYAEKLGAGNLNMRADIIRDDEIGALAKQFNQMGEALHDLVKGKDQESLNMVMALAKSIDARDGYTGGHCERVMHLALMIGEKIGLSDKELNDLKYASALHDIGKIGISDCLLNKPGKLSPEEYKMIQEHPTIGYEILHGIDFLKEAKKIVLYHHERLDGKGYPEGIEADKIPYLAQIITVADVFDAMTSSRPYRTEPMLVNEAIEELRRCSGTQFNGDIVELFVESYVKEYGDDLSRMASKIEI